MTFARGSSIERNLTVLSAVALALFASLTVALFAVQATMRAQEEKLEGIILPLEQDVARLEGTVALAFQRQVLLASATSHDELAGLHDRSEIERGLAGDAARLAERLALAGDDRAARAQAEAIAATVGAFLDADRALYESLDRGQSLEADFRLALGARTVELGLVTERSQALAGVFRLEEILLLRRVARGEEGIRPLVAGEFRARRVAAQDLRAAIERYSLVLVRLGSIADLDALHSILANDLPQARARALGNLDDLAALLPADAQAGAQIASLRASLEAFDQAIGDVSAPGSLASLRAARFRMRTDAAQTDARCRDAARRLLEETGALEEWTRAAAAAANRDSATLTRTARTCSVVMALLGIAVCVFAGRRLVRSVAELRGTNQALSELRLELLRLNEGLEETVGARTRDLQARERSLQLVLDATGDGLLSVALDGTITGDHSRAIEEWFGEPKAGARAWEFLFTGEAGAKREALSFACGWRQLVSDFLPFDLSVEQMPSRLERDGRVYSVAYKPVREGDDLTAVLLVIEDATSRVAAEQAERVAREIQAVSANAAHDAAGFRRALEEISWLVGAACDERDAVALKRALHTLKGNASMCGLGRFAAHCHALEDAVLERDDARLTAQEAGSLRGAWSSAVALVEEVVGLEALDRIELSRADHRDLVEMIGSGRPPTELLAFVERWLLEPAERPLARLGAQASSLASQLGKSVRVVIDDGGLRLDPQRLAPVWSNLLHAVRNAVDHGLEEATERGAAGKAGEGTLTLRALQRSDDALFIEVKDDGRGIDLEAVRAAARARGLPSETRADLVQAIFTDGLTTRTEATDVSGRGVGMGALRAAVVGLGGTVDIETTKGKGTAVRIVIPRAQASATPAAGRRGARSVRLSIRRSDDSSRPAVGDAE